MPWLYVVVGNDQNGIFSSEMDFSTNWTHTYAETVTGG